MNETYWNRVWQAAGRNKMKQYSGGTENFETGTTRTDWYILKQRNCWPVINVSDPLWNRGWWRTKHFETGWGRWAMHHETGVSEEVLSEYWTVWSETVHGRNETLWNCRENERYNLKQYVRDETIWKRNMNLSRNERYILKKYGGWTKLKLERNWATYFETVHGIGEYIWNKINETWN